MFLLLLYKTTCTFPTDYTDYFSLSSISNICFFYENKSFFLKIVLANAYTLSYNANVKHLNVYLIQKNIIYFGMEGNMKFGYFDDTNKEYVITTPKTPLPWINYLGCKEFFTLVSNTCCGYSFYSRFIGCRI